MSIDEERQKAEKLIDEVNTKFPGVEATGPIGIPPTVHLSFDTGLSRSEIETVRDHGFDIYMVTGSKVAVELVDRID